MIFFQDFMPISEVSEMSAPFYSNMNLSNFTDSAASSSSFSREAPLLMSRHTLMSAYKRSPDRADTPDRHSFSIRYRDVLFAVMR